MIKTFIQWRLQRGERIEILDILASSTTVGGAVTARLGVQRASILGTTLAALWILSPIAGQTSLRLLSTGNGTTTQTLRYSKPQEMVHSWANETFAASKKSFMNSLWVAYLTGSNGGSRGLFREIKIPMIEPLKADQGRSSDDDGWYDVPWNTSDYASRVGFRRLDGIRNVSTEDYTVLYPIETWYWALDCHNLTSDRMWISQQSSKRVANTSDQISTSTWKAGNCDTLAGTGCLLTDIDLNAATLRRPNNANISPRQIFFSTEDYSVNKSSWHQFDTDARLNGSIYSLYLITPDGHHSMSAGVCSMSTVYVEAEVFWSRDKSAVKRVRRSHSPLTVPSWTVFDCLECDGTLQFTTFAQMFTTSLRSTAFEPTQVSSYMADPERTWGSPSYGDGHDPASTLPRRTRSIRLAQLLNSYWELLTGMCLLVPFPGIYPNYDDPALDGVTTATVTQINILLKCNGGWLVASVFASSVLLVCCLATPLLRAWMVNPQLALNFSSLVRDNSYVSGSWSGTSLQASERAQSMGDLKIKFGDVKPDEPVGHIALASMDANIVDPVRKGRKYV
ncbi:hypothetical protein PG984_014903 [Apiospora sp. TS-2023a]